MKKLISIIICISILLVQLNVVSYATFDDSLVITDVIEDSFIVDINGNNFEFNNSAKKYFSQQSGTYDTDYNCYQFLDEAQKIIYDAVVANPGKLSITINFDDGVFAYSNFTQDYFTEVMNALCTDRPDIFYYSGYSIGGGNLYSGNEYVKSITYNCAVYDTSYYTSSNLPDYYDALMAKVPQVPVDLSNRYNFIKSLHDYLADTVYYPDLSSSDYVMSAHDAYGALIEGRAVAQGYSDAVKLICDYYDIPCVCISGTTNGGGHTWNAIQMEDGKWYFIDLTWDDQENRTYYDFFLVGTETTNTHFGGAKFSDEHISDSNVLMPNLEYSATQYVQNPNTSTPDSSIEYLIFTLNDDGKSYSVTDCDTSVSGKLVIPDTYNGLSVTSIGASAFADCKNITEITIPWSITSIGNSAFSKCTGIEKIYWNATAVADFTADSQIFSNAGTSSTGVTVVFGNTVKKIPAYLFYSITGGTNTPNITSVVFGDNIIDIGARSFYACKYLTSIIVPNSVVNLGERVFACCSELESVTLSNSITELPNGIFTSCKSLSTITIPDNVTRIGDSAFFSSGLTYLEIPDSVTSLGDGIFYSCDSLESVKLPNTITSIPYETFCGSGIKTIVIPDNVTTICERAFAYCDSIESITIPINVYDIEYDGFFYAKVNNVFYKGTESRWGSLRIDNGNTRLTSAKIHFGATGHTVSDWVVSTEATCTQAGVKTGYCSVCGEACSAVIPKLEHNYDYNNYEYVTNPDSENECVKEHKCKYCDATTLGDEIFIAIKTADDLRNIDNDLTASYVLMNDIDLTEATAEGGKYDFNGNGWKPIGGDELYSSTAFSGCFNGNDHEIKGLRIDISTVSNSSSLLRLGLFSNVLGTVKNLTVSGTIKSSVSNKGYVGSIAGEITGGSIENCHSYCNITAPGNNIGGIVGCCNVDDYFLITQCSNHGSILNTSSEATSYTGGIIAYNRHLGEITQCYNTGNLTASSCSGILAYWYYPGGGFENGYIADCYNIGEINGKISSGIHGGGARSPGNAQFVETCYNIGSVSSGEGYAIAGSAYSVENSYYLDGSGIKGTTILNDVTALSEASMQLQSSFTGFNFNNIWFIDASTGYPYPQLRNNQHRETECQHTYCDWVVDTEATCETDGLKHRTCEGCGKFETEVIPATGHDYSVDWTIDVAATCTTNGSKSHHCNNCGDKADVTEIVATGHIVGEWVVTTEPTCSQEGEKTGYCGTCGETCETEAVPTTEHHYSDTEYEYVQNPDNKDEYIKQSECVDCGTIGSAEDSYIAIRTIEDLYLINNNLSGNYVLLNDIDLTEATSETGGWSYNGCGWDPIGTASNGFEGVFDGNGYSIIGLRITNGVPDGFGNNSYSYYGLFTKNNGVIKNLNMVDANIYVYDPSGRESEQKNYDSYCFVGSICGENNGVIENCGASGSVLSDSYYWEWTVTSYWSTIGYHLNKEGYWGGLTGNNTGLISRSYNLSTSNSGIADKNSGYINECFNTGETTYGIALGGNITDCYTKLENIGSGQEVVKTSYYKTPNGGIYFDAGGVSHSLTDVQMKIAAMYSDFDFNDVWVIDTTDGYLYPQLINNPHREAKCKHIYSDWVIDTEATCEADGSKHRTCEGCGEVETEVIPATGHDYSTDWTIDVPATCTTDGSKSHHCNNCGNKTDVTAIVATGHLVGEWVITTEPTCSQEGEKTGYCGTCGEVCATEAVPTTEHNYNYDNYEYVQNPENPDEYYKQYECEDCGSTKVDENPAVIKSLVIESLPNKTTYVEGQAIDTTGLVVKLEFEDGTTEAITDYDIAYDNSVAGEQDVTVSFGNVTASFKVTFTAKNLVSIAVTKMPDKTTYVIGDSFDSTGMVVTATYDNGLTEEITGYTVSTLPQNVGKKNLMVLFGGKRVIIQVTVIEKKADSMTVIDPEKFEYVLGDEFDPTGMVVTVTFNNGAVEEVTDYTIEGFGDFIGPGYITLKYEDLSYEIAILMHAPSDFWVVETEATCSADGLKHLYCTECCEIARTEIIPATGHDYAETVIKQATCLEEGTKQFDCKYCDSSYTESYGGEHVISGEKVTLEPTCGADGVKYNLCSVCGETVGDPIAVPALGHDYSTEFTIDLEATCSQPGSMSRHCSRCDAKTDVTAIESSVHDYTDWVVTTPAGCETDGERTRSCSGCGEYFTETIAALGHAYSIIWTTDKTPTCTVDGSKSHHCNRCGDKKDITVIPATGHTFGEWVLLEEATCTVNGQRVRMCSTCYMEDVEILTAPGHTYGEWTIDTKADCENDGARHTNCTVCGTVVNETIKAYGHDYQSVFTVDIEATCTDAGSKSHHCSRCESKTDVTVIEPLGHHISTMWTIDKDPTCESEGLKSHHCLRCDCVEDVTTIPVANHIYGKWYVVTPATMDTAGVRAHKCYNCEMTEEAELPKLLKYTATFVADGDVVATVDFPEDATEIEIPEVPHKDKFNGEWENFDIRNKNFTVNAVYTPIPANEVEGIKTGNTADYYASTGEVEVNLNVSAPSRTIVTTTTKTVPLDIVFVLDQSGSMAEGGRKDALKSAVRSFSNAILDDAKKYSVDHRIAVVGFASGSNNNLNYQNTELLTSEVIKYDKITNVDYKNSLVSVNDNGALNNVITKAINAIDAEGATRADIGLEMATNIFANNPVTDNRQRVVVFLTDGVPTSYSNFEYNVANVAIQNAYQLKNTYDATVYSVGVFDRGTSADSKVNNFMNYVSSNYSEDVVMSKYSKETTENIGGYYLDVSDVSKLSDVFTSIVEETTTHTGRFTKATLKYTLTNNFVLTINQENAIRKDAVEKLGVTNEQISITRNDNGTTTIVISDVEPWASGTNYVIDFTFRATANGNTLKSGTYQVGTFESGVILENGEGYEAVFAPQSVDIGGTSGIAVFNINNLPYAINRLSSTTKVVAPATDFGADYNFIGWNVPNNLTLNNEARVFEAELLKNEYKLSWNIDGEITEVKYAVGDFITVPHVGNNSIGGAFVGWDMDIPETMPSENLTITAIYDAHYHKYDVTKAFESCTEGGTLTYTCECGDTYTEEIAPCEHNWEVITASNNQNAIENAGSRCSVCGIKDSKALRLEGKSTYQMADASYNTATVELDYIDENGDKHQPDGNVEISVQLDEVFSNDIPADATATVYRVNDDGSRTILNSEQKGMQMTFTTDHFSTYEFEFTTGTQKYLFAQPKSRIDYANRVIFSDMRLAREFKDFVSYLAPASVDENANTLGFMGTGSSITLTKDGTNTDYTVVINGDTNGDSVVDALDAAQVANASNGHKSLDGAYAMAADSNYDDEISIEDYQAIVNKVVA